MLKCTNVCAYLGRNASISEARYGLRIATQGSFEFDTESVYPSSDVRSDPNPCISFYRHRHYNWASFNVLLMEPSHQLRRENLLAYLMAGTGYIHMQAWKAENLGWRLTNLR